MFSLRRLFWCRAREIHWKTTADLNVFAKRLPRSTRALACKITRICLVPLFRTAAGKIGALTSNAMWQQDAYRMIQRRAGAAGIKTQDRQPHLPRHRHHRVPAEQGHARNRSATRQSRVAQDDQAL